EAGGTLADSLSRALGGGTVFGALLAELQRLPTIAVVEDIHWADDATLDALRYVGRRIARSAVLLVLTYREEISLGHPLWALLGDLASSATTVRIQLPVLSEPAGAPHVGAAAIDAAALHRQ